MSIYRFLKNRNYFFCFTPEVMLATFFTEVFLAIYTFLRHRVTLFDHLVIAILFLLAGFQIAEYQICASSDSIFWSRIGFVAITILPILGLHLVTLLTGNNYLLKLGYTLMFMYIAIFTFGEKAVSQAVCEGNYIIFNTAQELWWTYAVYYFGFLILGIWEAAQFIILKNTNKILMWLILGYLSFILPLGVVYMFAPIVAWSSAPSIMCGFALIFALILALKVVPLYHEKYDA